MPDAGAGTGYLDVTRPGDADVSNAVTMGHCALANVGHDLHVGVSVQAEAGTWRDLIIVPNDERTQGRVHGIAIGTYSEVMPGFEPTKVTTIERISLANLQHVNLR
jgi:hypothetical protein